MLVFEIRCRGGGQYFITSNMHIAEWTLGAVLYEDEITAMKKCDENSPLSAEMKVADDAPAFNVISAAHWTTLLFILNTFLSINRHLFAV